MIRLAVNRPLLTVVMGLMIVVLGGYTYTRIPADLLPQFNTPAVQIVTFYPGMPPEVMEKDIMSRLQRWTGQSVGIEHQEAKAMQGVCIVKDFFREDISMDTAMSQVTSYAMSDMFYLPPGTIPPMIMPFDPTASVPLCLVVVSNPTMDEQELYDIAYFELRNKLQSIGGVIAPAVYGGKLTTCRELASEVVDKLKSQLRPSGTATPDDRPAFQRDDKSVPDPVWCRDNEFCLTLDDYLRRRSNIAQWVPRRGLGRDDSNLDEVRAAARAIEGERANAALERYRSRVREEYDALLASV